MQTMDDSRTPKYAHRRFASESQQCQLPWDQNFARGNQFIAAVKVLAGRKNTIAGTHGRENSYGSAKLLCAFVWNHRIGATRNGCVGRDGQWRFLGARVDSPFSANTCPATGSSIGWSCVAKAHSLARTA